MAEIARITIGLEGDTETFREIEAASKQTAESIQRDNEKVKSSYEQLKQKQLESVDLIKEQGKSSSTFGENFAEEIKNRIKEQEKLNDSQVPFGPGQFSEEQAEAFEERQLQLKKIAEELLLTYQTLEETILFTFQNSQLFNDSLKIALGLISSAIVAIAAAFQALRPAKFCYYLRCLQRPFS